MKMRPSDLIARKRDGNEHSEAEIRDIIAGAVDGSMADYQLSAWLMAVFLRGMSDREVTWLTLAMRDSGQVLRIDGFCGPRLDKHSTGGVGDKTTLVVLPLLVAAGVPMLKMSGRGLGFTGGTIDKLESLAGFSTDLDIPRAVEQVRRVGGAIVGQTADLAPADKVLYALRDVTATVPSIPLIAASILSKKLAAGAERIVLDVKVGCGAMMSNVADARRLARLMVAIGEGAGVPTSAVLTAMDEPLGRTVGNALEVAESFLTLTDPAAAEPRFRDLCVTLVGHGLTMVGRAASLAAGEESARGLLDSGSGACAMERIVDAQGGNPRTVTNPGLLPAACVTVDVLAPRGGFVQAIDAAAVGLASMRLGAGRMRKTDAVDPAVGVTFDRKVGEVVSQGERLATVHARTSADGARGAASILKAVAIGDQASAPVPIVLEAVGAV